jgi:predicted ArsR family transcriptional regulator
MFSREKILTYLKAHPGVTATEMARALRVTPANIRHHLAALVKDGLAQSASRASGRGRPEKIYRVSEASLGDNLSLLVDVLLENVPASELDATIERLAARLAGTLPPERTILPRRLSAAIDRFSSLNYHPRWEAHITGPRIILGHCPYAAVIARHPELCRMDALALQKLLAQPVEQTARLEPNERGIPFCMFRVT